MHLWFISLYKFYLFIYWFWFFPTGRLDGSSWNQKVCLFQRLYIILRKQSQNRFSWLTKNQNIQFGVWNEPMGYTHMNVMSWFWELLRIWMYLNGFGYHLPLSFQFSRFLSFKHNLVLSHSRWTFIKWVFVDNMSSPPFDCSVRYLNNSFGNSALLCLVGSLK